MNKRRSLRMLLLVALVVTVLSVGASAANIVLDFPSWQAGEPGTKDWWNAVIAEFEELHEGVTIDFYEIPYTAFHNRMMVRYAAGDPPDISHLPTFYLPEYAQQGWIEPLNDYLEGTDILENWTSLQDYTVINDEVTGILLLGYALQLWVNTQLFDEAGVEIPTNPEEFEAAAIALSKEGQFGLSMSTTATTHNYRAVTVFVADEYNHWVDNGALNKDRIRSALQMFRRMIDAGALPVGLDGHGARQYFFEGRSAMTIDGTWLVGSIRQAVAEELQPYMQPVTVPSHSAPVGGVSNGLSIPNGISQERKDLAWEFLQLAASPKWQREYALITDNPPARAGVLTEEDFARSPYLRVFSDDAATAVNFIPEAVKDTFSRFESAAFFMLERVFLQNVDIDTAIADFEAEIQDLIN